MNKILVFIFLMLLSGSVGFSQNFSREAGIRGGLSSGFTYRHYLHESLSYEGLLSFRKSGMQFTLFRQKHEMDPSFSLPDNFRFLFGYGGHAGFYYDHTYRTIGFNDYYYPQRKFSPLIGIDAYAGLEYRFETVPFLVGIDYKPFLEFSLYQFFHMSLWDLAFTAKYRF